MKIFLLLLLFLLSSWSYNTKFLNLYFSSKMHWWSFRLKSLTITLFVFPNLWQAAISIFSNTTPSFSKINRTCSLTKSFLILLGIPEISIHWDESIVPACVYFSHISITFSFIFLLLVKRVNEVFPATDTLLFTHSLF